MHALAEENFFEGKVRFFWKVKAFFWVVVYGNCGSYHKITCTLSCISTILSTFTGRELVGERSTPDPNKVKSFSLCGTGEVGFGLPVVTTTNPGPAYQWQVSPCW